MAAAYFRGLLKVAAIMPQLHPLVAPVPPPQTPQGWASRIPAIPAPPSQEAVRAAVGGAGKELGEKIHHEVTQIIPQSEPVFQELGKLNQRAGNVLRDVRTNRLDPALQDFNDWSKQKIQQYVGTNNMPELNTGNAGKELPPPSTLYEIYDKAKPGLDWYNHITGGFRDSIEDAIPALKELHQAQRGIQSSINGVAGNALHARAPQAQRLAAGFGVIKNFEDLPLWRRGLGLTLQRPVVRNSNDFYEMQQVLNNPKLNEVAGYGLRHGKGWGNVAKGVISPTTAPTALEVGGLGLRSGASALNKILTRGGGQAAALGAKYLPAVSAIGRTAKTIGGAASGLMMGINGGLEVMDMYNNKISLPDYIQDQVGRQGTANSLLGTANVIVNNMNKPIGTFGATGKLLGDSDTYGGAAQYLQEAITPRRPSYYDELERELR